MSSTRSHWQDSSKVFNQRAEEYDSWFNNSLLYDIEIAAVRALSIPASAPALEIGVGPGRFAEGLGSGFGIDPAFAPLEISKTRDIAVCQAVGEALPFCSSSLAKVSLFFTLCFVQNPAEVIQESHRVLQESGHLVLGFVPATGKWGINLQQRKQAGHPFYEHANFFTVKEIERLLAEKGFSLVTTVSSLYQAPGEVNQMESPKPGLDENAGFIVIAASKKQTS
ncbi:MAG TPA: class I SAM-dependent methyltransferase [Desulfocapsa sulfexigens]|nr:class I SAM-dependent methyltransferase [Desulfocapsa sulfexigens]